MEWSHGRRLGSRLEASSLNTCAKSLYGVGTRSIPPVLRFCWAISVDRVILKTLIPSISHSRGMSGGSSSISLKSTFRGVQVSGHRMKVTLYSDHTMLWSSSCTQLYPIVTFSRSVHVN